MNPTPAPDSDPESTRVFLSRERQRARWRTLLLRGNGWLLLVFNLVVIAFGIAGVLRGAPAASSIAILALGAVGLFLSLGLVRLSRQLSAAEMVEFSEERPKP
jgi:hypothetical protein